MFEHLYREVNPSRKYDKYFPQSNCTPEPLGQGTTQFGVNAMKEFALKHQHQTELLTKEQFKTNKLEKLTAKIQTFLYETFQFQQDTYKQNLKSPKCAYSIRFEGIECKSYSIIAATILLNKDVTFYIRRIQQSKDKPNQYSHVYVVVPKNQQTGNLKEGYYVIDGNQKNQREVHFIKSEDILMESKLPYYGLNASESSNAQQASIKLQQLLSNLERLGVAPTTLISFRDAINYYTAKGIDPYIKKAKGGILVQDIFVAFVKATNTGLNGSWDHLTGGPITGGITTPITSIGGNTLPPIGTINTGGNSGGSTLSNILGTIGGISGGDPLGTAGTIGLDAATGGLGSTIAGLIGIDIGDTISNIMSGNFDCIGGSAVTMPITEAILQFMQQYQQQRITQFGNSNPTVVQKALNEYVFFAYTIKKASEYKLNKGWNSCSSERIERWIETAEAYISEIESIKQRLSPYFTITISNMGSATTNVQPFGNQSLYRELGGDKTSMTYPVYQLTAKTTTANTGSNNNGSGTPIPTTGGEAPVKKPSATPLLIGAGVAAKIFGLF